MGRYKLNRTVEEKREQARIRAKRYYSRHKEELNKKAMQRYWQKVGKKLS